jgi:hypothetical protein
MVGRAREVLPQSPTLSRGHLRLVGGDVSLVTCRSLIPPVSLIGNTSAMFRGTAKIFTELLQHPSGNNGCHTRGTTSPAAFRRPGRSRRPPRASSPATPTSTRSPSSIARMNREGAQQPSCSAEGLRHVALNTLPPGLPSISNSSRQPCQPLGAS